VVATADTDVTVVSFGATVILAVTGVTRSLPRLPALMPFSAKISDDNKNCTSLNKNVTYVMCTVCPRVQRSNDMAKRIVQDPSLVVVVSPLRNTENRLHVLEL